MAAKPNGVKRTDPVDRTFVLSALARFTLVKQAQAHLEDLGYEEPGLEMLFEMRDAHRDEITELRRRLAPEIEGEVADNALLIAHRGTEAESLAMECIIEKLQDDEFADPSTVLRNLSQVKSQNIDKRLALQGRPTTITQNRSTEEILRALEAKGVVERIPAGELGDGG